MSIDAAVACYKHLEEVFGFDALSGGNCGTAALAVYTKLEDVGIPALLAFVTEDEAASYQDVHEHELDLYHVAIEVEGQYVDGAGRQDASDLCEMAFIEYRDRHARVFGKLDPKDVHVRRAIDWETSWGIEAREFYQALLNLDLSVFRAATPTP
jgi:hypothetical protein